MKIQIENLSFRYKSLGSGPDPVLKDIHLEINEGEFLALVGPSGSGKTTLMQHFTGLLKPDEGRILVDDADIWNKSMNRTQLRRQMGLVFQFPESQLFEETVFDDIAFGPRNFGLNDSEVGERVQESLANVGLDFETFKDISPFHLSEGEKRRVAIAGILAMNPDCLILDEPTAGLDGAGVDAVVNTLNAFHGQGKTVLLISHNLDLVASIVERIVVINHGKIRFDGGKRVLFKNEDLLEEVGLTLPRIVLVVRHLKQKGWLDSDDIYCLDALKSELAHSSKLRKKSMIFEI
ncbi:ATP-binding cassette domain-containing protein [candidate division KSB1 bacterium]|nr:ATP-binding cassette domain-containing protein [candidate division KSB1 bacterium]